MGKEKSSKVAVVHEHSRRVRPTKRNPNGITIVDQHLRKVPGTYLGRAEIESIFRSYDRKGLKYPTALKLKKFESYDLYDDHIAVWADYFSKKLAINPQIDPNMVKALLESESGFRVDPKGNNKAFGIAQITKETWRVLQDPAGEAKDLIFSGIRQKDLKDPDIALPMAIRWLVQKRKLAAGKLKRQPSNEEIILEYKGLLKSETEWKNSALENYRSSYKKLTGK